MEPRFFDEQQQQVNAGGERHEKTGQSKYWIRGVADGNVPTQCARTGNNI